MKPSSKKNPKAECENFAGDNERWLAVIHRDRAADGKFWYSVKTTGVYCRPSCSARRPKRENVRFHNSCEEAEQAGFRACKKCQPDGASLDELYAAKVAAACRIIKTASEPPDLDALARTAGMSRFHFHRVFTKITGITPKAYASARRAEQLHKILPKRDTVTEAVYEAGFNSSGRFYAESSRMLGMSPTHFRKGGSGEVIRFAIGQCSLGYILVASSEKGICAVFLGDDPDKLCRELQDRFPKAQLIGDDKDYKQVVATVVGFVENPGIGLHLPLDVRGTAFQRRVWQALCKIPAGATMSYSEVAAQIGSPKSVRAVASACASNSIAVAIPCHRVLRTDGSLSGYRWGVERKRALLKRESPVIS